MTGCAVLLLIAAFVAGMLGGVRLAIFLGVLLTLGGLAAAGGAFRRFDL